MISDPARNLLLVFDTSERFSIMRWVYWPVPPPSQAPVLMDLNLAASMGYSGSWVELGRDKLAEEPECWASNYETPSRGIYQHL